MLSCLAQEQESTCAYVQKSMQITNIAVCSKLNRWVWLKNTQKAFSVLHSQKGISHQSSSTRTGRIYQKWPEKIILFPYFWLLNSHEKERQRDTESIIYVTGEASLVTLYRKIVKTVTETTGNIVKVYLNNLTFPLQPSSLHQGAGIEEMRSSLCLHEEAHLC